MLRDSGDLAGARAELERALVIYQATYGPRHPTVGTIRSNLGSLRRELERVDPGAGR